MEKTARKQRPHAKSSTQARKNTYHDRLGITIGKGIASAPSETRRPEGRFMSHSANLRKNNSGKQNHNSLYLLFNLVSKDFKLRYRRSILGVVWSMLNPLLMMIVMTLIFTNIFRFQFDMYPFAVYLILGQTLFAVFQDGATGAMSSIIEAAPLIKKVHVQKIIFPTEKVVFAVVNFCFSLIAVGAVLAFFGMAPSWKALF
ncbi:ABC transporter permease, partial [Rubneribacter badeniensis]|uniref:ABC transporter permease n=1 Tax=Rubneribacter badeniensis TaxID=2070688 RepID=UPI003A8D71F0